MGEVPEVRVDRSLTRALRAFDRERLLWLDEAMALGPLVALRFGPVRLWIVSDAGIARTILLGGQAQGSGPGPAANAVHDGARRAGARSRIGDAGPWARPPAAVIPIRTALGDNLFSQSERNWAVFQPLIAPAFRRSALDERLHGIDTLVEDDVRSVPHGTAIDVELLMGTLALRIAAWVLLGEELARDRAEELARHQREVVTWVGSRLTKLQGMLPFASGAGGRAMKAHRQPLYDYADEVIGRAQAAPRTRDDVLGTLLAARPSGKPLSRRALRSHVLGFLLAGNETTAAALSWAFVHGAAHPVEWAAVRDDPARAPAFVDETLRLTPAVWGIPRFARRAAELHTGTTTVRIGRGQGATIYVRGINRDPVLWPDPLRFDPSRHEHASKEQHRALLPFGLGARGCIGQYLATAELHAVLPALARHGDVHVDGLVEEEANFALRVAGGLPGSFTPVAVREDASATRPSRPT